MTKIIILCLCLFLPIGASAIFLNPGHFEPAQALVSGRPYIVNFNVSNNENKEVELITSIECIPDEYRTCGPVNWFEVFPKSFKLHPNENKQIEVRIFIPKNKLDGVYQNVLMISTNQGTNLSLSLGGIIRFEKQGDLNWLQRLYFSFKNSFQKNFQSSVGQSTLQILLYALATIGAILLLLKLIGFVVKRFR